MKQSLKILGICLLSTTCALASVNTLTEEETQGARAAHKRALERGQESGTSPKKQRAQNTGDAQQISNTTPTTTTTTTITTYTTEVNQARHFQENSPTHVWNTALAFDDTLEGHKRRYEFTARIMPQIMESMLVMYKCQRPESALAFRDVLEKHRGFSSMGKSFQDTYLWSVLMGIKNTHAKQVPTASFQNVHLGDGDMVFLNMLSYIWFDFTRDPAALYPYAPPKSQALRSPQARMHEAFILRQMAIRQTNALEKARLWDSILSTFDFLEGVEQVQVASLYAVVANEAQDKATKANYYLKSARLLERSHHEQEHGDPEEVKNIAMTFASAGANFLEKQDKAAAYLQSVQWWRAYFHLMPDPSPEVLRDAARTFFQASSAMVDPSLCVTLIMESTRYWQRFLEQTDHPQYPLVREAAKVHLVAATGAQDVTDKIALARKSIALLDQYGGLQKVEDVKDLDTLKLLGHAYSQLSFFATDPAEKKESLFKSVKFWEAYLRKEKNPASPTTKIAATVFANVAQETKNEIAHTAYVMRSAELWVAHLKTLKKEKKTPDRASFSCAVDIFEQAAQKAPEDTLRAAYDRLAKTYRPKLGAKKS
ncbi:MAG: hypothetical protein C0514_09225 [Candidatus Puniceispirillum sp.]|nr:hypothetical protein [Candidatus Puniceispirillum sp.]